ncbi:MAG TPA: pyridoxal-phosphate dependent enzyme, partial [Bacteroidales bacterium]|nr:pyridoxal-phosphate dependent enzyme [Bacteroidales bacterium]
MDPQQITIPDKEEVRLAAERIRPYIHRTPVLTSRHLDERFGSSLFFKCENLQKVGAFKARGATNALLSLTPEERNKGVATHSSGNHAQALAWAAALQGCPAFIVMPSNSSRVKVEAVQQYGGQITFCEPTLRAREATLEQVLEKTGAIEIHPYNNLRIIAGQSTAAQELIEEIPRLDIILAPVGGGGLLSGTALAAHYFSAGTRVFAAEPEQANDAWLSFTGGKLIPSVNPNTVADGLRTSLGTLTWPIIKTFVSGIVTVSEKAIINAMRLVWERMKILIEPSAAVTVAALLENKLDSRRKRVGIILSGGNV